MSTFSELVARREILLLELQIQRQLLAVSSVPMIGGTPVHARSATMRFILGHPHLCQWAVCELLPFLAGKFAGKKARRFALALRADQ